MVAILSAYAVAVVGMVLVQFTGNAQYSVLSTVTS